MRKLKTIIFIIIGSILAVVAYGYYQTLQYDVIDIKSSVATIEHDLEKTNIHNEEDFTDNEFINDYKPYFADSDFDVSYLNHHESPLEKFNSKEGTIEFFFASLEMNDTELFISAFQDESITEDLFASDNPDKLSVANELMRKFTKDSTIKEVRLYKKNDYLSNPNDLKIGIVYENETVHKINIKLHQYKDKHDEHTHSMYVISSKPSELLNQL
ncbi:hypothetical protein [Bacillus altitudinis]|uniref:hypothetical protein n=1 Tax=Bacillus altitudinis TaxID=293387 RepID=UPI001C24D1A6|nr:hypothetical protein [Bacillus altitudinis]MBU8855241.1 hypothetical protein [Bacillus sp. FJAT-26377]MCY7454323.1 hypothetical protein [Bacillus altitudinis]